MVTMGTGEYRYEVQDDWAQLPEGWSLREVPDVVVGPEDRVYVFSRGEHPMLVFDREGTLVDHWGEDLFNRPHGLTLAPDNTLFCVDDADHCIHRCTLDGQVLMTIGVPGRPAPYQSGQPFNRPTKVAIDRGSGDLFIADGYGNPRVHRFTADGKHLLSWGAYGTDPGEFNLVHTVCTDADGKVYITDRESHRVQVFEGDGHYITQWNNLHRPCGLLVTGGEQPLAYITQLPPALAVNKSYPNLGARVSIHTLDGTRLAWLGDTLPGEGLHQFIAPHSIAADSHGDLYVGEVSWSDYGRHLDPPREVRSFRKLVRIR
jgi:hypothetical protein